MVVGSAHTRVLVRDWVLVRDIGSTNAFEAVRRKAAGKMRPSIFVVQHDAVRAPARQDDQKADTLRYGSNSGARFVEKS